jgi:hypothetical protein
MNPAEAMREHPGRAAAAGRLAEAAEQRLRGPEIGGDRHNVGRHARNEWGQDGAGARV